VTAFNIAAYEKARASAVEGRWVENDVVLEWL